MKPSRYPYVAVALLFVLGCQGMPKSTKGGQVVEVPIVDSAAIGDIGVSPGDEVRWVNKRAAPVRVILIDPAVDPQVSCKNRFGGFMAPRDTAKLERDETASLCFQDPGLYRYVVRMESNSETGEINVPGVIKVGEKGGQAGQTSDPTMSAK
jgi:plastocyanin